MIPGQDRPSLASARRLAISGPCNRMATTSGGESLVVASTTASESPAYLDGEVAGRRPDQPDVGTNVRVMSGAMFARLWGSGGCASTLPIRVRKR